jgi:hypothetical protein
MLNTDADLDGNVCECGAISHFFSFWEVAPLIPHISRNLSRYLTTTIYTARALPTLRSINACSYHLVHSFSKAYTSPNDTHNACTERCSSSVSSRTLILPLIRKFRLVILKFCQITVSYRIHICGSHSARTIIS